MKQSNEDKKDTINRDVSIMLDILLYRLDRLEFLLCLILQAKIEQDCLQNIMKGRDYND